MTQPRGGKAKAKRRQPPPVPRKKTNAPATSSDKTATNDPAAAGTQAQNDHNVASGTGGPTDSANGTGNSVQNTTSGGMQRDTDADADNNPRSQTTPDSLPPPTPAAATSVDEHAALMEELRSMRERVERAEAAARAATSAATTTQGQAAAGPSGTSGNVDTHGSGVGGARLIPKPKGSAGGGKKGFHLIEEMGLDGSDEDKKLYNQLLSTVRELAHAARLDLSRPYREVSARDLHNIFATARKMHPFLARFTNDWATAEMLKQFMSSVRRYGKRKGYFACAVEARRDNGRRRLEDMDDDDE